MRAGLIVGHNVDHIDVAAGLRELVSCGYPETEVERRYVVQHALQRWARGEEEAAQRGAIDKSFHGIDLMSWIRVLAAARAGGDQRAAQLDGGQEGALKRCAAGRDGECGHKACPQLRDNEPSKSGRHCPLDQEGSESNG